LAEGILFEVGKFFKRKGLFQPFFKHHAAALRNGKLAVDHYGSTLFTTDRIKDEHDFHNPCPPTAQRLANYEISRNTPGSPHHGGNAAPTLKKIPDECADTTVLSQHAVEAEDSKLLTSLETAASTSGWVVLWQSAALSWGSRKQKSIALSSCEAEIIALSEAAKDVVYLRKLIRGLGEPEPGPSTLATDSQSARDVSYNPEHHYRMKHVQRRHFFIRDMVESFEIEVPFVRTADNLADFFTKPMKSRWASLSLDQTSGMPSAVVGASLSMMVSDSVLSSSADMTAKREVAEDRGSDYPPMPRRCACGRSARRRTEEVECLLES
jgi:hypothetical protein